MTKDNNYSAEPVWDENDDLAEMMVGREVNFKVEKEEARPTSTVLKINDLVDNPELVGINLNLFILLMCLLSFHVSNGAYS